MSSQRNRTNFSTQTKLFQTNVPRFFALFFPFKCSLTKCLGIFLRVSLQSICVDDLPFWIVVVVFGFCKIITKIVDEILRLSWLLTPVYFLNGWIAFGGFLLFRIYSRLRWKYPKKLYNFTCMLFNIFSV